MSSRKRGKVTKEKTTQKARFSVFPESQIEKKLKEVKGTVVPIQKEV